MRTFPACLLALFLPLSAAQALADTCSFALDVEVEATPMIVRPLKGQRLSFLRARDATSAFKAYVVKGDVVLVKEKEKQEKFRCALYLNARAQRTEGFLEAAALEAAPAEPLTADFLKGRWADRPVKTWEDGLKTLVFTADGAKVKVSGVAIWKGMGDTVHSADLDAAHSVDGKKTVFKADPEPGGKTCELTITRAGPYLQSVSSAGCEHGNANFRAVMIKLGVEDASTAESAQDKDRL